MRNITSLRFVGPRNAWLAGSDFTYQTSRFRGDKNFLVGGWGLAMDREGIESRVLPKKGPALTANCAKCHGAAMNARTQSPSLRKAEPIDVWEAKLREVRGDPAPTAPEQPATVMKCLI